MPEPQPVGNLGERSLPAAGQVAHAQQMQEAQSGQHLCQ